MEHLDALLLRRSNEKMRLDNAMDARERAVREVWLAQIDKEIEAERRFLKMESEACGGSMTDEELFLGMNKILAANALTDEELLAALFA